MGQYYFPVVENAKGEKSTFYSHDYNNGLKLMEHSYIGNNFIASVLYTLVGNPCKVWWIGDYAEDGDFNDKPISESERKVLFNQDGVKATEENQSWNYEDAYLINNTKKEYVKLPKIIKDEWQICPLSLLTAVGNGKGGGDYFGELGKEFIGTWAGDVLQVEYDLPENVKDFIDMTLDYYFKEEW